MTRPHTGDILSRVGRKQSVRVTPRKVCRVASDDLVPAGLRRSLYVRWAVIGLVPILLGLGACVAAASSQEPNFGPKEQARMDDIGAGLLALSALVFLAAFWFDGLWTFEPRLRRRCDAASAGSADRKQVMRARAGTAFQWLSKGASTLVLMGIAIPILAALHAHVSGSLNIAGQILVTALLYQAFLLSQYQRYMDAVAFIADPQNDPPDDAKKANGEAT